MLGVEDVVASHAPYPHEACVVDGNVDFVNSWSPSSSALFGIAALNGSLKQTAASWWRERPLRLCDFIVTGD